MATVCGAPTTFDFDLPAPYAHSKYTESPLAYKVDALYGQNGVNTLAWAGATPATGSSITGYEIQITVSTNDDISELGTWGTVLPSVFVYTANAAGVCQYDYGDYDVTRFYMKFRIRTLGAGGTGQTSAWKESPVYRRNHAPVTVFSDYELPRDGKTTYCSTPRMLIERPADLDGSVGYDGDEVGDRWVDDNSSIVPLTKMSAYAVVKKKNPSSPGVIPLLVKVADCPIVGGYGSSCELYGYNTTYVEPIFTDALTNGTRIKAVHITELRTMINTIRDYYSLSSYSWAEPVVAGTSMVGWRVHVAELRAAIDEVISKINGWDTTSTLNRVPAFTWIPIVGAQPNAAVMQQIRDIIPTL